MGSSVPHPLLIRIFSFFEGVWAGAWASLVEAAKARSGIKSDTDLLEYALARVALEDDFGQKLIAREGRAPLGQGVS